MKKYKSVMPQIMCVNIPYCEVMVLHYNDIMMGATVFQITRLTIVYSTVYSGTDQRKHQSSMSLAFVWGIHPWPLNSPHKGPVTRKMFPFDDVIMGNVSGQMRCTLVQRFVSLYMNNDLLNYYIPLVTMIIMVTKLVLCFDLWIHIITWN